MPQAILPNGFRSLGQGFGFLALELGTVHFAKSRLLMSSCLAAYFSALHNLNLLDPRLLRTETYSSWISALVSAYPVKPIQVLRKNRAPRTRDILSSAAAKQSLRAHYYAFQG
jgi:hypothetical protein